VGVLPLGVASLASFGISATSTAVSSAVLAARALNRPCNHNPRQVRSETVSVRPGTQSEGTEGRSESVEASARRGSDETPPASNSESGVSAHDVSRWNDQPTT
jgi:hypothetical protein